MMNVVIVASLQMMTACAISGKSLLIFYLFHIAGETAGTLIAVGFASLSALLANVVEFFPFIGDPLGRDILPDFFSFKDWDRAFHPAFITTPYQNTMSLIPASSGFGQSDILHQCDVAGIIILHKQRQIGFIRNIKAGQRTKPVTL